MNKIFWFEEGKIKEFSKEISNSEKKINFYWIKKGKNKEKVKKFQRLYKYKNLYQFSFLFSLSMVFKKRKRVYNPKNKNTKKKPTQAVVVPATTQEQTRFEKNKEKENNNIIPEHLITAANQMIQNLVPDKSSSRYHHYFDQFEKWCENEEVNIKIVDERIMLAYFKTLLEKNYANSTLWTRLSAIKTVYHSKGKSQNKHLKILILL